MLMGVKTRKKWEYFVLLRNCLTERSCAEQMAQTRRDLWRQPQIALTRVGLLRVILYFTLSIFYIYVGSLTHILMSNTDPSNRPQFGVVNFLGDSSLKSELSILEAFSRHYLNNPEVSKHTLGFRKRTPFDFILTLAGDWLVSRK